MVVVVGKQAVDIDSEQYVRKFDGMVISCYNTHNVGKGQQGLIGGYGNLYNS
jgi:hypothetical protein